MLDAPRKGFRAGNQLGKTWAGLRWLIDIAQGKHPHQHRPPPVECWIVCTSWSQSVAIMGKFHALIDQDSVDEKASSNFSTRNGYGKDNPTVLLTNGSVIRFRTTNQGPMAFQGATITGCVLIDEPTALDIYRELDRRLLRTGAPLGITFTPVNRDCRWIRELTDKGVIQEVHANLTVENLTPIGSTEPLKLDDGTPMDASWIEAQWRSTPDVYADIILDGEWDGKPIGQFFKCFDRGRHVSATAGLSAARGPVRLVLGIDHATAARELGQCAVLAKVQQFVDGERRTREAIVAFDEVVMSGADSSQQFGAEIANMLRRHSLKWSDLFEAYGDNPSMNRHLVKGNQELARAVSRQFGVPLHSLHPKIRGAKEGRGASGQLDSGCRYLYEALSCDLLMVHPRCEMLIEAFETWDWDASHPAKDRIDALRYALRGFIFPRTSRKLSVRIG